MVAGAGGPPTFLYALPLPDGRVFLEETSLVAAPALPMAALEARLAARLAARGIRIRAVHATERCGIPMNAPLPLRDQRGLAFGAAGGLVHPASGYSVSTAFQLAPSFAATLAANVDHGPTAAAAAAWDELWPTDRVRARHLHLVGSAALSRMAPAELRAFFTSFFSLPIDVWSRFLASNPGATEVAGTMLHLFRVSPPGVRWSLATRSAAASGPALFSVLGT
jgi:lycopene beta-cyclase